MYKVTEDNKYTGFIKVFKTTMHNLGTKKRTARRYTKAGCARELPANLKFLEVSSVKYGEGVMREKAGTRLLRVSCTPWEFE